MFADALVHNFYKHASKAVTFDWVVLRLSSDSLATEACGVSPALKG